MACRFLATLAAFLLMFLSACGGLRKAGQEPSPAFAAFVEDNFDALFQWNPSLATAQGFHQYDGRLADLTELAHARRIDLLKGLLGRVQAFRAGRLLPDEAIDAEILEGQIRAELLELETLATWKKNPVPYISLPGHAVHLLMKREFALPSERLRSVVARLHAVPAVMAAMRANVTNPPKEYSELAVRVAEETVRFFREGVMEWGQRAAGLDNRLQKQFEVANSLAASSLEESARWLKAELLPRSKGDYAIGAEGFRKKLLYEEMVDVPLEQLLAIGEARLERDYKDFVETAREIDPKKTAAQVMKEISGKHPGERDLVASARDTLEGLRRFLAEKQIVTVPSEARPLVQETPPFARIGIFAAMDAPGAYETSGAEAFYYVTPPEASWDAARRQQHLRLFNGPLMQVISIHEVYPGHYLQSLYQREYPTRTRKLVSCATNAEGWAHYAEQMMVEEGYGGGDPRVRLAQLQQALLRDCRFLVGIKLHTQRMSVEEGARVFVEKAFQEPANAYEEARRGTYNPTYLAYTLGKLQIQELRLDYRQAKGAAYSLRQFHDDFLRQGAIPIKMVRRILLPGSPASGL